MVDLDSKDLEQFVQFHTGIQMNHKKSAWETFKRKDKLLLLLLGIAAIFAFAAVFVLLTPLTNFLLDTYNLYIDGWAQLSTWLLIGDVGLGIAIALGFVSLVFLLLARFRYLRSPSVYITAGCPDCHEHELIRVQRHRKDRVLGFFGVPVRRYACRNCTWQGTRLAKYSTTKENEISADNVNLDETPPSSIETHPTNGAIEMSSETFEEASEPANLEIVN